MTSVAFTTGYQFVKLVVEVPPANKLPDNDSAGHVAGYEPAAPMTRSLQRDRNFEVFGSSAGKLVIPVWLISPSASVCSFLGNERSSAYVILDSMRFHSRQNKLCLSVVALGDAQKYFLSRLNQGALKFCFVSFAEKRRISMCVGCGSQIQDQYILRVAPDLEWHAGCLKCADCHTYLDETCTCFVRDGKTYCKRDYVR